MKYAAIDFETANYERASACALGIVVSDGQTITDEWYHLIRPPKMHFEENCMLVNHISPDMVEHEPEFPAFWEEVASRLEGTVVFAHNAPFDMGVLAATLDWYDLPAIHFRYGCTVKLSRMLWQDMENHRLNTVAGHLGFSFQHHQALADAQACAFIVHKALEKTEAATVEDMMAAAGQNLCRFQVKRTRKPAALFEESHGPFCD